MAGFRPPKPLGTFTSPIDSGTCTCQVTPPPGPVCTEAKGNYLPGVPSQLACPCTGRETTSVSGLPPIPSYQGDFPSPLQVMWYVPDDGEAGKTFWPDTEIRTWIKDAAAYHGIPHVLLAVILQQENAPGAPRWRKLAQFAERSLTTFSAIVDKYLWDVVPDKISGGSSGFVNMSRAALLNAAEYTENLYCKGLMPHSVRYRRGGWDQDTRISGDDWKADLYYASAHLRQLIDITAGAPCHCVSLTVDQLQEVIRRYNGSGPKAEKYAQDAMQTLMEASRGKRNLYFYET